MLILSITEEMDHAVRRSSQNYAEPRPLEQGKLTGAKAPLRPKNVWSIRTKLQVEGGNRELAMFNLAIDSKLRACDVVRGCAGKWPRSGSGHGTAKEDGPAGQIRID